MWSSLSVIAFFLAVSGVSSLPSHKNDSCGEDIACDCVESSAFCSSKVTPNTLLLLANSSKDIRHLHIKDWHSSSFNFSVLQAFPSLESVDLSSCALKRVEDVQNLPSSLSFVSLQQNRLYDWQQVCGLMYSAALRRLAVGSNKFESVSHCQQANRTGNGTVTSLDLSSNPFLTSVSGLPDSLTRLNLSYTSLQRLSELDLPSALEWLSVSWSKIASLSISSLSSLSTLDVSTIPLTSLTSLPPSLTSLTADHSFFQMVDVSSLPLLETVSLAHSQYLTYVHGPLPSSIRSFTLTHSLLLSFHPQFFSRVPPECQVNLSENRNMSCSGCFLEWALYLPSSARKHLNCSLPPSSLCPSPTVLSMDARVRNTRAAHIPCHSSLPHGTVEWWLMRPATFIGSYNASSHTLRQREQRDEYAREVLPGGVLHIPRMSREQVERYVCVVRATEGGHSLAHSVIKVRMDWAFWYSFDRDTVFWGSILAALVACAASFLLNITWIISRKSILWWIQRAERISHVRKMVEAMEKYRTKQMEMIHDNYKKRVHAVRDTYHQQMEQLRVGYTSQVERFRDYRTEKMENVHSHLENIRDNYQQQMQKVREYGSRRADLLWESYERQMNRVRMFNLHSRLKIMRQYNLKQRYINKLFESFQREGAGPDDILAHEERVRAVLEMPDGEGAPPAPHLHPLSRSSSFYSLPEYVLGEDGALRPSPLIPLSSDREPRSSTPQPSTSL